MALITGNPPPNGLVITEDWLDTVLTTANTNGEAGNSELGNNKLISSDDDGKISTKWLHYASTKPTTVDPVGTVVTLNSNGIIDRSVLDVEGGATGKLLALDSEGRFPGALQSSNTPTNDTLVKSGGYDNAKFINNGWIVGTAGPDEDYTATTANGNNRPLQKHQAVFTKTTGVIDSSFINIKREYFNITSAKNSITLTNTPPIDKINRMFVFRSGILLMAPYNNQNPDYSINGKTITFNDQLVVGDFIQVIMFL